MDQTLLDKTNKLKLYLCCVDMSAAEFARSIGYTPQMITGYLARRRRLSDKAARIIETGTGGAVSKEEILNFNPCSEKYMLEYKPLKVV